MFNIGNSDCPFLQFWMQTFDAYQARCVAEDLLKLWNVHGFMGHLAFCT